MSTATNRRRGQATGQQPSKKKIDENTAPAKPLTGIQTRLDPYSEEMEKKYNIEGSNIQEVVFLRQDNDAINGKIRELEALNQKLQAEVNTSKVHAPGGTADTVDGKAVGPFDAIDGPDAADGEESLSDALARENAELRRQLEEAHAQHELTATGPPEMIPRPRGSAGNNFNIEEEMGLGDTAADHDQYKALQRNLRDLMLQARINWEVPWAEVAASSKGQLFAVARERHPYLARFTNDWATEEIVKQYKRSGDRGAPPPLLIIEIERQGDIKNKRRHAYKNGWLEAPTKFEYLKANSTKRNPSAPRKKSKSFDAANKKKASKNSKKISDTKKQRKTKTPAPKAKPGKTVVESDSDSGSASS
ncbi:hypothetical protein C8R44DRAFT_894931 [Mycena epipterygia]|nr:hypothetical protein C8R44DRAFT_894931 [Mycena epipterygia]